MENHSNVFRVRFKGQLAEDEVYVGRAYGGYPESKWGNPFRLDTNWKGVAGDDEASRIEVIRQYKAYLLGNPELVNALPELIGKRLGCWCAPRRCHASVLAWLAERLEKGEMKIVEGKLKWVKRSGEISEG